MQTVKYCGLAICLPASREFVLLCFFFFQMTYFSILYGEDTHVSGCAREVPCALENAARRGSNLSATEFICFPSSLFFKEVLLLFLLFLDFGNWGKRIWNFYYYFYIEAKSRPFLIWPWPTTRAFTKQHVRAHSCFFLIKIKVI